MAFNPAVIEHELSSGRPIQAFYQYANGSGHTALVVGMSQSGFLKVSVS